MGPVFSRSWLFGIACNTCLDQFRKCARQQRHKEAVKLFVPSQREDRTVSVALEQIFLASLPTTGAADDLMNWAVAVLLSGVYLSMVSRSRRRVL
jgi:DNA-directed RNA polymerase specialized sigma24 family protein